MTTIPPRPTHFAFDAAPVGVEYRHVLFGRPKLRSRARLILIHTNAARGEGDKESAWNWAHAAPNSNTCPTYQVDMDGSARKMLRSDEDAIANCTEDDDQGTHGDVSEFSLAIETADSGTDADPTISAFTAEQCETIATIVAYEAILNDIPLVTPETWFGSGVAGHTDPFGYPLWTCRPGKICPGDKKKWQVRNVILPRAIQIMNAWQGITPPPPEPPEENEDMAYIPTPTVWDNHRWQVNPDGTAYWLGANDNVDRELHWNALIALCSLKNRAPVEPWRLDVNKVGDKALWAAAVKRVLGERPNRFDGYGFRQPSLARRLVKALVKG